MKTFAFDSIERYSRFSETRQVKKLLCNKTWRAFIEDNDKDRDNESDDYTFMPNGTVMIAHKQSTYKASWTTDSKNKVLTITGKNTAHQFTIIFFSKEMLVINPDGASGYVFLINLNNDKFFKPRFYPDLIAYFRQFDKDLATQNEQANKQAAVSEPANDVAETAEQQQLYDDAADLRAEITSGNRQLGNKVLIAVIVLIYVAAFIYNLFGVGMPFSQALIDALFYGTIITALVTLLFINRIVRRLLDAIDIRKWKKANPDDPRNPYL